MTTRKEFVEEVRSWIDTPFHHEGRVKAVGVDCVGVAVASAKALGVLVEDRTGYPKVPGNGLFEEVVDSQTTKVEFDDLKIGDLIKFRFNTEPQHLAIVSQVEPCVMIVHAFSQARKCVETNYDGFWEERLVGIRRIAELTE